MEYEMAVIEKIENGMAKIRFIDHATCKGCGLCKTTPEGLNYIELPVSSEYVEGQEVRIGINSNARTLAAVLLFLLPLVVFIIGLLVGNWALGIPDTDDRGVLYSLGIGGACMGLYLLMVWFFSKRSNLIKGIKPFVIER